MLSCADQRKHGDCPMPWPPRRDSRFRHASTSILNRSLRVAAGEYEARSTARSATRLCATQCVPAWLCFFRKRVMRPWDEVDQLRIERLDPQLRVIILLARAADDDIQFA